MEAGSGEAPRGCTTYMGAWADGRSANTSANGGGEDSVTTVACPDARCVIRGIQPEEHDDAKPGLAGQ